MIVQDTYHPTETSIYADALLPAATWIESEGTMVNSERRLVRLHRAVEPKGEARCDWELVSAVARRFGFEKEFDYPTAESIFEEIKEFPNPRTGYLLGGVTYDRLSEGSLQWPCPGPGFDRGSNNGMCGPGTGETSWNLSHHDSGKARFWARPYLFHPREESRRRVSVPVLNTGRFPHHWHTRTRTGKVAALNRLNPAPLFGDP